MVNCLNKIFHWIYKKKLVKIYLFPAFETHLTPWKSQMALTRIENYSSTIKIHRFIHCEVLSFDQSWNHMNEKGGGRNFELPNLERPILQNLKIANIKSCQRSSYSIFLFTKLFSFFFSSLNTQIFVISILTLQFFIIFQIHFLLNF